MGELPNRKEEGKQLMSKCIEETKSKREALNLFIKKTENHRSTAYDYYNLVKYEYDRFVIKNDKIKNTRVELKSGKCYFCSDENKNFHHMDYLNNIGISLCDSCHNKIHIIFKKYHKLIIEKDRILVEAKRSINLIKELGNKLPNFPNKA